LRDSHSLDQQRELPLRVRFERRQLAQQRERKCRRRHICEDSSRFDVAVGGSPSDLKSVFHIALKAAVCCSIEAAVTNLNERKRDLNERVQAPLDQGLEPLKSPPLGGGEASDLRRDFVLHSLPILTVWPDIPWQK
jgi:hypothetical protein